MMDWKKHKLESRLPGEISITSDIDMMILRSELILRYEILNLR